MRLWTKCDLPVNFRKDPSSNSIEKHKNLKSHRILPAHIKSIIFVLFISVIIKTVIFNPWTSCKTVKTKGDFKSMSTPLTLGGARHFVSAVTFHTDDGDFFVMVFD